MAIFEEKGRMTYKDSNGDLHRLYPVTKKECVEGIEDLLPMPGTAAVGQYLEVESVDSQGRIISMKAVNAPSGGEDSTDIFLVTLDHDTEKASHSASEIFAVAQTGRAIAAQSANSIITLVRVDANEAVFASGIHDIDAPTNVVWITCVVDNNKNITTYSTQSKVVPPYASEDEGKTLVVGNNGLMWADGANSATELPFFDLAAMGLPSMPFDGTTVSVDTDCSELFAALEEGPVRVKSNALSPVSNVSISSEAIVVGAKNNLQNIIQFSSVSYFNDGSTYIVIVEVRQNKMSARAIDISSANEVSNILAVTMDSATNTASHSPAEIAAAISQGKAVVGRDSNGLALEFDGIYNSGNTAYFRIVHASSAGYVYGARVAVNQSKQIIDIENAELYGNFLPVTLDSSTQKASHSAAQIKDAYDAGKVVFLTADGYGLFPLFNADDTEAVFQILFQEIGTSGDIRNIKVTVDNNRNADISSEQVSVGSSSEAVNNIPFFDLEALGLHGTQGLGFTEITVDAGLMAQIVEALDAGRVSVKFGFYNSDNEYETAVVSGYAWHTLEGNHYGLSIVNGYFGSDNITGIINFYPNENRISGDAWLLETKRKYGNLVVFGDSFGAGTNNDDYSFVDILSESHQYKSVKKHCFPGATIGPYQRDSAAAGYSLVEQIERYPTDVQDADIIFLEYGGNDILTMLEDGVSMGSANDAATTATICGYTRKALERIRVLNPDVRIMWLSTYGDFPALRGDADIPGAEMLFEETALRVVNNGKCHILPIGRNLSDQHVSSDGVHPNTEGHKYIADIILSNMFVSAYSPSGSMDGESAQTSPPLIDFTQLGLPTVAAGAYTTVSANVTAAEMAQLQSMLSSGVVGVKLAVDAQGSTKTTTAIAGSTYTVEDNMIDISFMIYGWLSICIQLWIGQNRIDAWSVVLE